MMISKSIRSLRSVIRCFSSSASSAAVKDRRAINKEIRVRLSAAYRGLDAYGLNEGVCSHMSAIAPSTITNDDIMLMIPFELHWSEVTPSRLLEVNMNKEIVDGKGEPEPTALVVHTAIYSKRPDARAVMHTHMPYATALSCLKQPRLMMIHQNSLRFHNRIAYDTAYGGLLDSVGQMERLGEILGQKSILIMGNHGIITVAESIDIAFDDMYYLERAAMIQVLASSMQQNLNEVDNTVVEKTSKEFTDALPTYSKIHLDSVIQRLKCSCTEFS